VFETRNKEGTSTGQKYIDRSISPDAIRTVSNKAHNQNRGSPNPPLAIIFFFSSLIIGWAYDAGMIGISGQSNSQPQSHTSILNPISILSASIATTSRNQTSLPSTIQYYPVSREKRRGAMNDYDLRESGDQSSRASRLIFRPAEIRNPSQNLQAASRDRRRRLLLSELVEHGTDTLQIRVVATLKLQGLKLALSLLHTVRPVPERLLRSIRGPLDRPACVSLETSEQMYGHYALFIEDSVQVSSSWF
jgi:hypothetical protein